MARTTAVGGGKLLRLGSRATTIAYLERPRRRTLLDRLRRRIAR